MAVRALHFFARFHFAGGGCPTVGRRGRLAPLQNKFVQRGERLLEALAGDGATRPDGPAHAARQLAQAQALL